MDPAARALRLLSVSFGLSWVAVSLTAAPGPAAWVALSGDTGDAGHFFATYSLSAAVAAGLAGRLMDRVGRKRVLVAAYLLAATGYAVAGMAVALASLPLFAAGTVALAAGAGGVALTRLAAGELVEPARRAGAVARVQVTATLGAVLGPLLLVAAALGPAPDRVAWLLAAPALLAGAVLVALVPEPRAAPAAVAAAPDAPLAWRPLAAGVLALACAQAAMVTVMGVTGVALHDHGHGAGATGLVMAAHFLGMFGLSLVVGRVADRAGRRVTILVGLGTVALGGLVVALAPGPVGLGAGLLAIGLGWSFAYIGGTVVIADVVPAARRARTLGLVDFGTALLAAAASLGGGAWYAARGLEGLGLVAVAAVALPLVLALALREAAPGRYAAPGAAPRP